MQFNGSAVAAARGNESMALAFRFSNNGDLWNGNGVIFPHTPTGYHSMSGAHVQLSDETGKGETSRRSQQMGV
jgi:hypothetical protein